jgi:hypothetical protein
VRRPRRRRDGEVPAGHSSVATQEAPIPHHVVESAPAASRGGAAADLFIVGTMYSGSTYLGGLIAANLDAAYAGEMAHLPKFMEDYRLYDEQIGCLICSTEDRECPVWTPEVIAEAEKAGPGGSMEILRRRTGKQLVVDGSKFPEWLRLANNDAAASSGSPAVVLGIRSPLRYSLSAAGATGQPVWVAAQWWRDTYTDALRTISRRGLPMVIVRNEDVRSAPERVIASIARLVGRAEPAQLRPAISTHSIAGNLWVQKGYSHETAKLQYKLGLRKDGDGPVEETWDNVAKGASISERTRPRTRTDAVAHAQAVLDCPGLPELAQNLGYELAREVDEFVSTTPTE